MATVVPPTPAEAAEIERAQEVFLWARLYTIQVLVRTFYSRGGIPTTAIHNRFVVESSCFWDHGSDELEVDPTRKFVLYGRRAPGIFFGSAARDMAVPIKAETFFDTAAGTMLVDN